MSEMLRSEKITRKILFIYGIFLFLCASFIIYIGRFEFEIVCTFFVCYIQMYFFAFSCQRETFFRDVFCFIFQYVLISFVIDISFTLYVAPPTYKFNPLLSWLPPSRYAMFAYLSFIVSAFLISKKDKIFTTHQKYKKYKILFMYLMIFFNILLPDVILSIRYDKMYRWNSMDFYYGLNTYHGYKHNVYCRDVATFDRYPCSHLYRKSQI